MVKLLKVQVAVLAGGTLFALANVSYELFRYYCLPRQGPFVGCSGAVASHPLLTACFFGFLFYLAGFVTALEVGRVARPRSGGRTEPEEQELLV